MTKGSIYRMIDDASQGQNQTFGSTERIHTTAVAAAVAVTMAFRRTLNQKLRGNRLLKGTII